MPKAVLVIDMPERCENCPFANFDGDGGNVCDAINDYIDAYVFSRYPQCPLKPLPEKCDIEKLAYLEDDVDFMRGWNACLTELMEEENEIDRC